MRENFSIYDWWCDPRITYNKLSLFYNNLTLIKLISVLSLLKNIFFYKDVRYYFIIDNFIKPYNKIIGCKIFNHKIYYDKIYHSYICKKCDKIFSKEEYNKYIRIKKIKNIL